MEPRHEPEELADDPGARPTEHEGEIAAEQEGEGAGEDDVTRHDASLDEEDQSGL